jgi:hypothetical protein
MPYSFRVLCGRVGDENANQHEPQGFQTCLKLIFGSSPRFPNWNGARPPDRFSLDFIPPLAITYDRKGYLRDNLDL